MKRELRTLMSNLQLDKPEMTWDEYKVMLKYYAEEMLATTTDLEDVEDQKDLLYDLMRNLEYILSTQGLNPIQVKAAEGYCEVAKAAIERLRGRHKPLVGLINAFDQAEVAPASEPLASKPIEATSGEPPLYFKDLVEMYLQDRGVELKPATLRAYKIETATILKAFVTETGEPVDLRKHTREDLVRMRNELSKRRVPNSVNATIAKMGSVLSWGVNNGLLKHMYTKDLKLGKGTKSSRIPMSDEHIVKLLENLKGQRKQWRYWFTILAVITGARRGEIAQLHKENVYQVDGYWVIDINDELEGQTVKTERSIRTVPLVDGAFGFDLKRFLEIVDGLDDGQALFSVKTDSV